MEPAPSSLSSYLIRISPVFILIVIILAVIFFISGLLHLLARFLMKRSSSSPIYQSNRNPDASGSLALQRQLQQLFRLHDSGLDQASIDALPVFFYKDIMGLKEPFDCAVCLCEFSEDDKLRLLPLCSHAFHTYCIDTWLLSNSTCPLCRGTLFSSALPLANPLFSSDSTEIPNGLPSESDGENGFSCTMKPGGVTEEVSGQKKVFPVRLGKFRSVNDRGDSVERGQGESSSCNLDARRCFSLGSFRYVVGDSNLRVALSEGMSDGRDAKLVKGGGQNASSAGDSDHVESCRKISSSKGESFSISKVWLWPKKSKLQSSLDADMRASSLNVSLPLNDKTQIV